MTAGVAQPFLRLYCAGRRLAFLAVALAVPVGACDSGPSGEGSVTVSVEWNAGSAPLGAALVFVGAPGLGEVSALDGAMAWSHARAGEEGGLRVLVLHTGEPRALRFTVRLDDLSVGMPQVSLLSAATQENQNRPPPFGGYQVRVF